MNEDTCESCKFWRYFGVQDGEFDIGTCHRYPPLPTPKGTLTDDATALAMWGSGHWSHPTTEHLNWCGEFKAQTVGATPHDQSEE